MRLPRLVKENQAGVDREKAYEMIRYAADHGINYFDTAYGYHARTSEEVLGEALEGARREKVKIATKQPYSVMEDLKSGGGKTLLENARRNLENTLKKLRTSYIDVYLIHGIGAHCWEGVKKNKVIDEYEKFRAEGLIKSIAFSYHGNFALFSEVLEFYDWAMCQVQHNFMDMEREVTVEGVHLAGKKGCALVIMEPLRGGGLATPPGRIRALYDVLQEKRTGAEWAFRYLLNYPEVSTVLSGMSTLEQVKENIEIFSKPGMAAGCLSSREKEIIAAVKAAYESVRNIPCTACGYCLPCPSGVEISGIFSRYNDGNMFENFSQAQRSYMFATRGKRDATSCVECGECEKKCPQGIEIMKQLKVAHEALKGWVE
jgi:predicted aldo/keto reductase-like oxidoreductase